MLNRLTVSTLLKTVILAAAVCIVVVFSLSAWDSWGRLQATNRISVIADTSSSLFKAMHNLRTDQSTTDRLLNAEQPMASDIDKYLRNLRDVEMPAMGSALGLLPSIEFAQQDVLVPKLDRLFKTLTALQKEFWDEVAKPKGSRRPTLAKEYFDIKAVFPQGTDRVLMTDNINTINIPRATSEVSGGNFEVLVGFDVTPEMADFNRLGKRFRVNVAAPAQTASATPANP